MDSADSAVKTFFVRLTSPEVMAEIIAIVIASLIALAGAQIVRAWHKRHAAPAPESGWQAIVLEGVVLIGPFVVALAVLVVVRGALGMLGMHTAVVNIALQLTMALVLVRLGVYILRLM